MGRFMNSHTKMGWGFAIVFFCGPTLLVAQVESKHFDEKQVLAERDAVLWRAPTDITGRDLFYGQGGQEDAPTSKTFTYVKEDLKGTSPKFDVRDQEGVKWRVKLGEEARPETVATRLLWAVGYFTNEDYFLPLIKVEGMQPVSKKRRNRVKGLLDPDGTMYNARLKRYSKDEKKIGSWKWKRNPFTGTRELNGLRVMMAVINNWDLKDENNSVYFEKELNADDKHSDKSGDTGVVYVVSDVGASFATSGRVRDRAAAKGNFESYRRSKFICRTTVEFVDFCTPRRESLTLAVNPKEFIGRLRLRWIGRHIPRSDAKWMGQLLAQLSQDQILDAFRAAGYPPEQAEVFADVVGQRIAELEDL